MNNLILPPKSKGSAVILYMEYSTFFNIPYDISGNATPSTVTYTFSENISSTRYYENDNKNNIANVENAYNILLNERDTSLEPLDNSMKLSEEDILCSTNLQTAILFKKLSEKYKGLSNELNLCNGVIQDTNRNLKNSENSNEAIMRIITTHNPTGLESFQNIYLPFHSTLSKSVATLLATLDSRRNNLESEIRLVTNKLNALRKIITVGVKEIVSPDEVNKKLCPVCFDREVDMAMVPCGHTFCKGCSDVDINMHANCPQCRTAVRSRIKIFFSV
jgi:hypothetical protein